MKSRTTARCAGTRLLKGFAITIECRNGQTQENDEAMFGSLILRGFVVDDRVSSASRGLGPNPPDACPTWQQDQRR